MKTRILLIALCLPGLNLLAAEPPKEEKFPPLWEVPYQISGPGERFCRAMLAAGTGKGQIIGADYTSEFTYAVRVHGKIILRDWTLDVDGRRIERDPTGAFVFVSPLKAARGEFEMVARSSGGLIERCTVVVDYKSRYMELPTKELLSSGSSGEFFFGPHFVRSKWSVAGAELTQIQLGMRFGFNDYRREDYLAYSFEGLGTLGALSKSAGTAQMNTYQLSARIGRRITPPDRRLVIVLLAGAQYFTSTGSMNELFKNKIGVTFYPTLDYRNREGRVFQFYVKYVPYLDGIRLFGAKNSELGLGIGYDGIWKKLKPDDTWVRLGVRFDISKSDLRSNLGNPGTYTAYTTSFVFSW